MFYRSRQSQLLMTRVTAVIINLLGQLCRLADTVLLSSYSINAYCFEIYKSVLEERYQTLFAMHLQPKYSQSSTFLHE